MKVAFKDIGVEAKPIVAIADNFDKRYLYKNNGPKLLKIDQKRLSEKNSSTKLVDKDGKIYRPYGREELAEIMSNMSQVMKIKIPGKLDKAEAIAWIKKHLNIAN